LPREPVRSPLRVKHKMIVLAAYCALYISVMFMFRKLRCILRYWRLT